MEKGTENLVIKKESVGVHHPRLNPVMQDGSVKKKIASAFKNGTNYRDSTVTISGSPFTHGVVKNFLIDDGIEKSSSREVFVHVLQNELWNLHFSEKSNDLYKFAQSEELMVERNEEPDSKSIICPHKNLNRVCSLFRETLLPWMREISGVELNDSIDMFCAQYKNSDVLLCHDDEFEDRRIAYILYLTADWSEEDGGTLDLFNVNGNEDPSSIEKSLVPSFNTFVFFEVSPISFHQVSEVLSKHKTRLSLSGWFHGKPLTRPQRPPSPRGPAITYLPAQQETDLLMQWINPGYLEIQTQGTIQEQFEGTSEIQLPGFLKPEKYKQLTDSLNQLLDFKEFWTERGPPNKRQYLAMKFDQDFELLEPDIHERMLPEGLEKKLPKGDEKKFKVPLKTMDAYNLVNDFVRLFCSEEMFLYMSNVTGLSFHPMAANVEDSEDESSESDESEDGIPKKRSRKDSNQQKQEQKEDAAGLNSKCRYEIRCWSHGCYTLLRDTDAERGEFALDVNLHCGAEGWQQNFGGYTSYIAEGEDAELLTVVPASNCLSLAYRDNEALRFVKHVNQKALQPYFDFFFVFSE